MAKHGRGLNREVVAAVNTGDITEPFGTEDVRALVERRGWTTGDNMLGVTLANGSGETHSAGNTKYFEALGGGRYQVRPEYKGNNWR